MNMRNLIPWSRSKALAPTRYHDDAASPFAALHREIDRLLDDAARSFDLPDWFGGWSRAPSLELSDTGREIRVSAEVPGIDEQNLELSLSDGVLTIRGHREEDSHDAHRRVSERAYGRFERSVALPSEVDEEKATATLTNGVLTVVLPKSARAVANTRRIPISTASH